MGAGWVEIAQHAKGPRVRSRSLGQYLLAGDFGEPIGVCELQRSSFADGHLFWLTIDGGGRRKHQMLNACGLHRFQEA